jgi:uncharacterized protein (TIGR02246 family)
MGCGNQYQEPTNMMSEQEKLDSKGDESAIREILRRYERALNTSAPDAVMALYAEDGVFMPQHSPSSVGAKAVKRAYEGVFGMIRLDVKFEIVEVQVVAPNWAFARTNSSGSVTVLANGSGGPEANQELFVFQKVAKEWKIARYCFSTTNPPR